MVDQAIDRLIQYARQCGLLSPQDAIYSRNRLLALLGRDGYQPSGEAPGEWQLPAILEPLLDYAAQSGLLPHDSIAFRDLFDTALMGCVTPPPSAVIQQFQSLYETGPQQATDWFYELNQACHYIRRDRMQKDIRWTAETPYGRLDLTINLAKPEKDPIAIAQAAQQSAGNDYPACLLCRQNEGYAGHAGHPARQNLRLIPLELSGESWYLQYSPYVYYNEHCIVLSETHRPMKIDRMAFSRLFEFVRQFPHYFVGSNADLPIVGGSILSHDHFQGGHFEFAMARAAIETPLAFSGYEQVTGGIIRWPLSVIRLQCADYQPLIDLADHILHTWRGYSDESAFVFAHTDAPHNTITPIARMRGGVYEIDLALRNNITTEEHPLGVFHPHSKLHHIKKENIGLIEAMGLAVLPARLQDELRLVASGLLAGADLTANPQTAPHAEWAATIRDAHPHLDERNIDAVLQQEVAAVFVQVLEDAGVFKRSSEGQAAFLRFVHAAGGKQEESQ